MNTIEQIHPYQHKAISFILDKKKCALYLDMGLGKTVITLTAIKQLLDEFSISRVLIIGPLRVINNVWHNEIKKWKHLQHLRWSIVTGNPEQRLNALKEKAEIYLINRENVQWLYNCKYTKWDMVVLDESSGFKSPASKRWKSIKNFKYDYMVELTGTPSPNGLLDLWSQIYLIDKGNRLGKSIYSYKEKYFLCDYTGYNYFPINPSAIYNSISDITISMQADDYVQLPEKICITTKVQIPESKLYNELKKEFSITVKDNEISVFNAAALTNKLLQFCNGAVYDENKNVVEIHKAKLDALEDIITDYPNDNILIAYNYRSDLERLRRRFKNAVVMDQKGENIDRWNEGKIKLLLCHPASCGKGLNLQYGGRIIIWFGLTWNLEDYLQFNARLYRTGQSKPVIINHIVAENCMDEILMKVISNKNTNQQSLFETLKSNC